MVLLYQSKILAKSSSLRKGNPMTDIGLGLIDRRTVIVVIFSMVLAQTLWGAVIPVDVSDVSALFFGIIILTGYIYLGRSIYRLPVAIYLGVQSTIYRQDEFTQWHKDKLSNLNSGSSFILFRWLQKAAITFYMYLSIVFVWTLLLPMSTLDFQRNAWVWRVVRLQRNDSSSFVLELLRILDRIGLIVISVLATMPWFERTYMKIGIGGIVFMLILFVFSGAFTAIVEDMLSKQENAQSSSKIDKVEVENSESHPLYVELVNKNKYPPLNVQVENIVSVLNHRF
jgi:hypothetical protein